VVTRIEFNIRRGVFMGFSTEFLTDTKGEGILHHVFAGYGEYKGDIGGRNRGVVGGLLRPASRPLTACFHCRTRKVLRDPRTEVLMRE